MWLKNTLSHSQSDCEEWQVWTHSTQSYTGTGWQGSERQACRQRRPIRTVIGVETCGSHIHLNMLTINTYHCG